MRGSMVARVLSRTFKVLAVCVSAYAAAALLLGSMSVNSDFKPVANGVEVYLVTNGVHAALVLPMRASGIDLSEKLPLPETSARAGFDHVLVGWGDRRIYPATKALSDLTAYNVLTAFLGLNGSVMHVRPIRRPALSDRSRSTRIGRAEYEQLIAYIARSFRYDATGKPIRFSGPDSDADPYFFLARGSYQPFFTCNEWVRGALSQAGIRTARWSPLDTALFHQFPG